MRRYPTVPPPNWLKARDMRHNPTPAECLFWKAVCGSKLGVAFRRQHPIGPYIVDFVCFEARLIVELDGDGHFEPEQRAYDIERDLYLKSRGYDVRRYPNRSVIDGLESVLADIAHALKKART
jgi:very-short-patch-repair endonuclease